MGRSAKFHTRTQNVVRYRSPDSLFSNQFIIEGNLQFQMWTCPECQHRFVNRNQSHSCGAYTVGHFLHGKTETARALFRHFLYTCETIGTFALHPVKTRVALMNQMRFAAINRLGKEYIAGHLVLIEKYNKPYWFYKIDNLGDRFFVHHFRATTKQEITRLKPAMRLAYRVGFREHVKKKGRPR